jgi:hypothetical protein
MPFSVFGGAPVSCLLTPGSWLLTPEFCLPVSACNMLLIILCGFDAQMRMNPNDMSVVSGVRGPGRSSNPCGLPRILFGRLPHPPVFSQFVPFDRSGQFGGCNAVAYPTESKLIRLNPTQSDLIKPIFFLQPRTVNPEPRTMNHSVKHPCASVAKTQSPIGCGRKQLFLQNEPNLRSAVNVMTSRTYAHSMWSGSQPERTQFAPALVAQACLCLVAHASLPVHTSANKPNRTRSREPHQSKPN